MKKKKNIYKNNPYFLFQHGPLIFILFLMFFWFFIELAFEFYKILYYFVYKNNINIFFL